MQVPKRVNINHYILIGSKSLRLTEKLCRILHSEYYFNQFLYGKYIVQLAHNRMDFYTQSYR
jgi:hypothetical protein